MAGVFFTEIRGLRLMHAMPRACRMGKRPAVNTVFSSENLPCETESQGKPSLFRSRRQVVHGVEQET